MVKVIRLSWIFLSFWFTIGRNMNLATSPPPVVPPSSTSRVVAAVATWQFGALAVEACAAKLLQPGASALDAVEAGINVVELDDAEQYYVGLGGLPNAKGVVECDAAVMDHRRRYGAVMGLTDIATPVSVARSILEHSPHSIISGEGAKQWAVSRGFPVTSMLTDKSRDEYVSWLDKQPPIPPVPATATATEQDGVEVSVGTISQHAGTVSGTVGADVDNTKPADCHDTVGVICLDAEGRLAGTVGGTISADVDDTMPVDCHDTVGVICLDAEGRLACGTSTSGWAYKHPGRVGDSPVVGAGLYCDGRVGAAVATGDGEEILRVCLSHLVVELMRNHMSPQVRCAESVLGKCRSLSV
jgi:N4-(beta-N-acetylglucosaminyl)-L-asparaginase